jgi:uncharacterized protein YjbI with pentapeptide repeats
VANDEQVALLRKGSGVWNEWCQRNFGVAADLRGAKLGGMDLSGVGLNSANLSGADLNEAIFRQSDLIGANLTGAALGLADFSAANLRGANLSGANLVRANLSGADLSGVDLSGAHLLETIFAAVNLTQTKGLNECKHIGPSSIDFRTLSLSTNLPIPFLRGCGLPDNFIEYLPSFRATPSNFTPVSSVTRQRISYSPIDCMRTCRTKAFDAGSRRMICPSAPRPGMRSTRRSG